MSIFQTMSRPSSPITDGVRAFVVKEHFEPVSPNGPANVPFTKNARLEAYDYGGGKDEKGDLIYNWWKATIEDLKPARQNPQTKKYLPRMVKLKFKGFSSEKWNIWVPFDGNPYIRLDPEVLVLEKLKEKFSIGQLVLAKWTDGLVYEAEILDIQGFKARIQYVSDNITKWVNLASLETVESFESKPKSQKSKINLDPPINILPENLQKILQLDYVSPSPFETAHRSKQLNKQWGEFRVLESKENQNRLKMEARAKAHAINQRLNKIIGIVLICSPKYLGDFKASIFFN